MVMGKVGGFTLLEMLVAVVILTLIMGAAFGAVRLSQRSYTAGVDVSRSNGEMRAVSDFLRRQLGELAAVRTDDDLPPQLFSGGPDVLNFVAPAPAGLQEGGLLAYELSLRSTEAAYELLLGHDLLDPGTQQPIESTHREIVLVRDLETASFGYFGRAEANHAPRRWHDAWPAASTSLPELVRIRLTGRDGASPWPELLLRVRPESDT